MKLYIESELYHYGVPGMKWGQKKTITFTKGQTLRRKSKQAKKAKVMQKVEIAKKRAEQGYAGEKSNARYMKDYANKGSTYAKNILSGAALGTVATVAKNWRTPMTKKQAITKLVKGASIGAGAGALYANYRTIAGKEIADQYKIPTKKKKTK